jgi:multiple sugar transport system permease protein
VLFVAFLATLLVPFEMRMIPLYGLMRDLHINNTMAALIVPFLVGGFGTFLMRQYILSIPDDLIDAARLDGAVSSRSTGSWFCRCAHRFWPRSR